MNTSENPEKKEDNQPATSSSESNSSENSSEESNTDNKEKIAPTPKTSKERMKGIGKKQVTDMSLTV